MDHAFSGQQKRRDSQFERPPKERTPAWEQVRAVRASTPRWAWPPIDFETLPEPGEIKCDPVAPPKKYQRLHQWFNEQRTERLEIAIEQLNELVTDGLPAGATTGTCAREWWTNNPRKHHCRAWINAGYLVTGDRCGNTRTFMRGARAVPTRDQIVVPRLNWLRHLPICRTSTHENDLYDRPTSVYIIHLNNAGLYKVGVSAALTRRMYAHAVSGRQFTTVQTLPLRHRSCAYALEAVVLNLTEQWRTYDDPWRCSGGYIETWSAAGAVPELRHLAEMMNPNSLDLGV